LFCKFWLAAAGTREQRLNGKSIAGSDSAFPNRTRTADRALCPADRARLRFTMLFSHEFDAADSRVSFETGRPIYLDVTEKTGL
jgi:hypothetical protein